MRYLISQDAGPFPTERLRNELAELGADPLHGCAWMIESGLTARELIRQLQPFLQDGDRVLVVDVTDREAVVGHFEPEEPRTALAR